VLQVIVPAYNEEARLPQTLRALRSYVLAATELPDIVEVIVVDNASTDATSEVARREDSPVMRVRVMRCETPGKGAAVRAGIAASTASSVGYMDADGATAFDALATGLALLEAGADVAAGSRAVPGSVTAERHSRVREWGAALYRRFTAAVVSGINDTQCGLKVMRGDVARELMAQCVTDGFSFDVELLARARHARASIIEFPVTWVDVPGSTFDPVRHGLSSFVEVAQIARLVRSTPAQPVPLRRLSAVPAEPLMAVESAGS
jgi:dolichyl-phosphate beta-glucosyltransferase